MTDTTPDTSSPLNLLQQSQPTSDSDIARETLRRYEYVKSRGHVEYTSEARRNEDFYLGGGLQWPADVKQYMETVEGRPASECNELIGAVNTAIGYQIANRMDIQYVPASSDADPNTAKALGMLTKQILEQTRYKWHETQLFGDGLIAQRGYIDVRLEESDNALTDITLNTIDPMDVIPDPDAKTYDPEDWLDVIVTRWLTLAEIEAMYGKPARDLVEAAGKPQEGDFGDGTFDDGIWRNRFGDNRTTSTQAGMMADGSDIRYRIIDRQHHRYDWAAVAIYPTGEVVDISTAPPQELQALKTQGVTTSMRRMKRVRWTCVAYGDVLLYDEWSPFSKFTIVPYFPIFRRGRTRGLIDNGISPQETLNKAVSQAIAITNGAANTGWMVPKGSLVNMTPDELETKGSMNGLIVEFDPAAGKPEKIDPNPIPAGISQLIQVGRDNIKAATGVNESMMATGDPDMSGVAIQSRQFAAQQGLALPLDNLSRTRHMVAERIMEYIQKFMPQERIVRVTDHSMGMLNVQQVPVNQQQPDGSMLHDLTVGKYDIVITDQPMQITFDNSQFEQIKAMAKDFGYKIPPTIALRYSNLPDKATVAPLLEQANSAQPNPMDEAKTGLMQMQTALAEANKALADAKTLQAKVTAIYSATQAAAQAAALAGVAPVADEILASAGFVDENGGQPIPTNIGAGINAPEPPLSPGLPPGKTTMPGQAPEALARLPHNTNPLTPAHPDVGVDKGIEKPGVQ